MLPGIKIVPSEKVILVISSFMIPLTPVSMVMQESVAMYSKPSELKPLHLSWVKVIVPPSELLHSPDKSRHSIEWINFLFGSFLTKGTNFSPIYTELHIYKDNYLSLSFCILQFVQSHLQDRTSYGFCIEADLS